MGSIITDAELAEMKKSAGNPAEPFKITNMQRLIAEVERLRKEIAEDDEIIDDLRCAGAEGQTEIKRMWAQFALIKDILALASAQMTDAWGRPEDVEKNLNAALEIAAKEYLTYPKPTSGGVELTDEVVEHLTDKAEAGYDISKLRPQPPAKS